MSIPVYTILFVAFAVIGVSLALYANYSKKPYTVAYIGMSLLLSIGLIQMYFSSPTLEELGILKPNPKSIAAYTIVLLLYCLGIFFVSKLYRLEMPQSDSNAASLAKRLYLIFYIIVSSPIQEFIFRSYLYYSLMYIGLNNVFVMILLSGVLFTIAHLFVKDKVLLFGMAICGLIWGALYFYYPSLLLVSIIHALTGTYADMRGLLSRDAILTKQ